MDSKFAERMHHLDGGFTPLNFLFPNLPLPSYKRRDKAQQEMSDFYVNIMKKRDEGESEVCPMLQKSRAMACCPVIVADI